MNKITLEQIKKEYHENDICMAELLANIDATGLNLEESVELYKEALDWADGENPFKDLSEEVKKLRSKALQGIINLMETYGMTSYTLTSTSIQGVWFNRQGEGQCTIIREVKLDEEKRIVLEVDSCEVSDEDELPPRITLNYYEFACKDVSTLSEILNLMYFDLH